MGGPNKSEVGGGGGDWKFKKKNKRGECLLGTQDCYSTYRDKNGILCLVE